MVHELTVIVCPGKTRYIAQCLDVDVKSDGLTEVEAADNVWEALQRYFEEYEREQAAKDPDSVPHDLHVKVFGLLP